MPRVHCTQCKSLWAKGSVGYPAWDIAHLERLGVRFGVYETVDEVEMERMRRIIQRELGPIYCPPGTGFGHLSGRAGYPLPDFCSGNGIFASDRAIEALASEGCELVIGKEELKRGKKVITSPRPLQFPAMPLATEESLDAGDYERCKFCGIIFGRKIVPSAEVVHVFRRDLIPVNASAIVEAVSCTILVSDEFAYAVRKHALTGIEVIPWNRFED